MGLVLLTLSLSSLLNFALAHLSFCSIKSSAQYPFTDIQHVVRFFNSVSRFGRLSTYSPPIILFVSSLNNFSSNGVDISLELPRSIHVVISFKCFLCCSIFVRTLLPRLHDPR